MSSQGFGKHQIKDNKVKSYSEYHESCILNDFAHKLKELYEMTFTMEHPNVVNINLFLVCYC